ncbi:hypothetical protein DV515_00012980 [Chloebia gouldiae]|uniref:Uncharacterized protein n=1 Tax=Chloebia gouldiae TaxID=44316 RepID=A0A3L8S287_CHLGU|nr:hypothetical protein DV515_00012980 [Chloebia gouldiae]
MLKLVRRAIPEDFPVKAKAARMWRKDQEIFIWMQMIPREPRPWGNQPQEELKLEEEDLVLQLIFWTDFIEFISGFLGQEEGRPCLSPRPITGWVHLQQPPPVFQRGQAKSLHGLVVNNGVNNDNGTNVLCLHELHLGKSASTR